MRATILGLIGVLALGGGYAMADGALFHRTVVFDRAVSVDDPWRTTGEIALTDPAMAYPATFPGPADTWAGGEAKRLAFRLPFAAAWRMTLVAVDAHESAPPTLRVYRGDEAVARIETRPGAGLPFADRPDRGVAAVYDVDLPAADRYDLANADGSWIGIGKIVFTAPFGWGASLSALLLAVIGGRLLVVGAASPKSDERRVGRAVAAGAALSAAIALPGGAGAIFSGLPWNTAVELAAMAVGLPTLLLLGWRWLATQQGTTLATAALGVKLLLALAPADGVSLWIYDTPAEMAADAWRKSYDTSVHPGVSMAIDRPVISGADLPIDWLYRRDRSFTKIHYPHPVVEPTEKMGPSWLGLRFESWVDLAPGERVVLRGGGEERPLTPDSSGRVAGEIVYDADVSGDYAFYPIVVGADGEESDGLTAGRFWRAAGGARRLSTFLTPVADGALIAAALLWCAATILFRWRRGDMDGYLLAVAALGVGVSWLMTTPGEEFVPTWAAVVAAGLLSAIPLVAGRRLGCRFTTIALGWTALFVWLAHGDCSGGGWTPVGVAALVASAGLILWFVSDARIDPTGADAAISALIALMPLLFVAYLPGWLANPAGWSAYGPGSDPLTYQVFAHEIFVGGDWLHAAGEPVLFYQPFYRYLVGGLHTLFGQSSSAQRIVDLWGIAAALGGMTILVRRTGGAPVWGGVACGLYLLVMTDPLFIWQIGVGMQELTSNLFLYVALALAPAESLAVVATGAILAGFGFVTRIDRIGFAAALGVLSVGGHGWRESFVRLRKRWGRLALWVGIVALFFAVLPLRNFFVGDTLTMVYQGNWELLLTCDGIECAERSYRQIFFGKGDCVDRGAAVLAVGTAIALASLAIRRGALGAVPVAWGIVLAGLLSPYWIGGPTNFEPRFSYAPLPLTAAILALFFRGVIAPDRNEDKS